MMTYLQDHLRTRRADRGFTLVELLIVVVIVAVLVAIAVPQFVNQRKRAFDAQVTSSLRDVALQLNTALADDDWATLRSSIGSAANGTIFIDDDSGLRVMTARDVRWAPPLPAVATADGIHMQVIHRDTGVGVWNRAHGSSEFCLMAMHARSSYNWRSADTDVNRYARILYYDTQLGGVRKIQDIARAQDAGQAPACYVFANYYRDGGGTY